MAKKAKTRKFRLGPHATAELWTTQYRYPCPHCGKKHWDNVHLENSEWHGAIICPYCIRKLAACAGLEIK